MTRIATFLMLRGRCEEAVNFYIPLFRRSGIVKRGRYGAGDAAPGLFWPIGSAWHASCKTLM